MQVIDGKRYSPFWSFFLDKQSHSYSLSKFQLFVFFAVFVFGYIYVFLCRWLVQWQFLLPDVPTTFTAILGMSAGTTLVAAGATATRGSKGSGSVAPSAADFISIGGQVVPERFQFFVWTLIACLGFVALLVSQDPALLHGFPSFPSGLLYVMGISAGGYLGGKLARAPGPVIRNIAWDDPNDELTVQGENLSKNGDFFIEDKILPIVTSGDGKQSSGTLQDQPYDGSFCSELKIKIKPENAGIDLHTGDHVVRIMNKDGQFADSRFTADPPRIESVSDDEVQSSPPTSPPSSPPFAAAHANRITASEKETHIKVTGSGFRPDMMARWTAADAIEPKELPSSAIQSVSATLVKLTLVPGPAGNGTLTLITKTGFSAIAAVEVS